MHIDSQVVMAMLNKPLTTHSFYTAMARRILQLLTCDWVFRIIHAYRESNWLADWSANKAFDMDVSMQMLDLPPSGCYSLLLADVFGISFLCCVLA